MDGSCENFKSLIIDEPSFDILYLYQDLFKQLRSIILQATDNLNEKIDRAEELNSNVPKCQINRPGLFIAVLDSFDDFIQIFSRRMKQLSYGLL